MNILEEEDFIKGLPDSVLMEEAQRPTGSLTQFVVVSEIKRRSDMRKEHEAQLAQGPQSTVKDQIIREGIMSSMPPQMAMAPQMPQRMPQMPPQGIQQAMPPQMMSGGGIVRMNTGGFLDEVLVKAPNLSDQKLEELIIDGVPAIDLVQMGFTADDISRVGSQIEPRMIREGRKVLDAAPDAIYDTLTFDSDRAQSIVMRATKATRAQNQAVQRAQQAFLGRTDIPQQGQPSTFSPVGGPLAVGGGKEFEVLDPSSKYTTNISLPFDLSLEGTKFAPVADLVGRGIAGAGDLYDSLRGYFGSDDTDVSGIVAADPSSDRGQGAAPVDTAALDADQQNVGLDALTIDPNKSGELVKSDLTQNQAGVDAVDLERLLGGGYDASRVDYGDATIPSGADATASRLDEYMKLVNDQASRSRDRAFGMATAALGAGILEGKTAQGIRDATKIIGEQDKAQAQVQSDIAKLRVADAREREKLNIMRQDLANKLKITDRQSLMAALKSYGDSITALVNDRTRLMTEEGQTLMTRLTQEQALLRSLLIPDVDLGDIDVPAPTPSQPSGVDLRKYLNP